MRRLHLQSMLSCANDTNRRKVSPPNGKHQAKCLSIQSIIPLFIVFIAAGLQQQSLVEGQQQQPFQQPPQQPAVVVMVPGSGPLLREPERVDQIIMPNEAVALPVSAQNGSIEWQKISYVIDHKRYVESVTTRCLASTILEDPDALEPSFIIIRPQSEVRLNATAPAELIRQRANFDPRLPTKVFVHGFTQSYPSTDWLRKTRALFERNRHLQDNNLIFMDWGTASHGSYSQVAARASGMGAFLANFLLKLTDELGAPRMSLHLICHSLGAHICGFAGKRLQMAPGGRQQQQQQQPQQLGRITALDPAGPCFGKFLSNSANDRLAPRDAFQVDVFHYDDDFLGLGGQIGQFDVYVNGGASQPGAKDNWNTMFQAFVTMVFRRNRNLSESHTRSTEVPTSQLAQEGCQQMAYECRDWPAFLSGECGHCDPANSQCFFMGFQHQYGRGQLDQQQQQALQSLRSTKEAKRFYIATSGRENFCLHHHQILVRFEPDPELAQQSKRFRWRLQLELFTEGGDSAAGSRRVNMTLTNQMLPLTFSYLLLTDPQQQRQPERFTGATLRVRQSDNSIVQLRPANGGGGTGGFNQKSAAVRVTNLEVNFLSNVNPAIRAGLSSRLCPTLDDASFNTIQDSTDSDGGWLEFEDCSGGGGGRRMA